MNQHEASLFQQMAHFVLTDSSDIKFLLSTDNDLGVNVNEKYGLTKADIITLEECGILNSLRNDNRISLDSNPCGIWSENILLILKLKIQMEDCSAISTVAIVSQKSHVNFYLLLIQNLMMNIYLM